MTKSKQCRVFLIKLLSKTEKKSKTNEYVKIHKTTTEISIGATAKRCNVLKTNLPKEDVEIKYISSIDEYRKDNYS